MNEFPVVLVINCGSSSIKFSVLNASDCEVLMSGIADGINSENAFLSVNGGEPAPLAHHSYEGALKAIAFELEKRNLNDSVALIGHRIAHGGSIFTESAIITDEVIDNIRRVSPLAPLHNYAKSISTPNTAKCSMTRRRIKLEFSPIPPVNIIPSRRCNEAACPAI